MNTLSSRAAFGLVLVLVVAGVQAGCSSDESSAEATAEERTPVETLLLQRRLFEDKLELNGEATALNDATLSAEAGGTVLSIAEEGASVKAGQTVAKLEDREAQASVAEVKAQLQTARAQLAQAEDSYQRQEPLYRDSIISALEFEQVRSERSQARASVNRAKAQLASARERLSNTRLRAPFSGTVEARFVEPGEQISNGQDVARVIDVGRVELTADVPERYANDVERGQHVIVTFDTYGTAPRQGQITFVSSAIDPQSRTFRVKVEIPNADRQIKPEMSGRMVIPTRTIEDALVIPRTALERDEEGTNVYVVRRRGARRRGGAEPGGAEPGGAEPGGAEPGGGVAVTEMRSVTVGPTYEQQAVVLSGLEAGQELIVSGQSNVAAGDTVRVTQQYQTLEAALAPSDDSENL